MYILLLLYSYLCTYRVCVCVCVCVSQYYVCLSNNKCIFRNVYVQLVPKLIVQCHVHMHTSCKDLHVLVCVPVHVHVYDMM